MYTFMRSSFFQKREYYLSIIRRDKKRDGDYANYSTVTVLSYNSSAGKGNRGRLFSWKQVKVVRQNTARRKFLTICYLHLNEKLAFLDPSSWTVISRCEHLRFTFPCFLKPKKNKNNNNPRSNNLLSISRNFDHNFSIICKIRNEIFRRNLTGLNDEE